MAVVHNIIGLLNTMDKHNIEAHEQRCVVFRDRNARCRRCAEACTTGCIHRAEGTLSIDASLCIGCGTCASACPSAALLPKNPDDEALFDHCVRALQKDGKHLLFACERSAALACDRTSASVSGHYEELPADRTAASVGEGDAMLSFKRTEASICEGDAALPSERYDLKDLVDSGKGVVVPGCLGRLDETLLIRLFDEGAEDIALFVQGCESCPYAAGGRRCIEVYEAVRELLEAFCRRQTLRLIEDPSEYYGGIAQDLVEGQPDGFTEVRALENEEAKPLHQTKAGHDQTSDGLDVQTLDEPDVQTSDEQDAEATDSILGEASDGTTQEALGSPVPSTEGSHLHRPVRKTPAKSGVVPVREDGTLPRHLPLRRKRLLDVLSTWTPSADEVLHSHLWGNVEIDLDMCRSCRMCAVFCPTGSLSAYNEDDGTFGLCYSPSQCVCCKTCESICMTHAIHVVDGVSVSDVLQKETRRIPLKKPAFERGGAHSAVNAMRYILDNDHIYEK